MGPVYPVQALGTLSASYLGVVIKKNSPGDGPAVPIIRASDLPEHVGYVNCSALQHHPVPDSRSAQNSKVELNDVIIVARGSGLKVGLVGSDAVGAHIAPNLMLIRPNTAQVLGTVLALFLSSPRGRNELMKFSRASTLQMSLSRSDIKRVPVPVPPLATQLQIDALFTASNEAYKAAIHAAELRRRLVTRCAEDLLFGTASLSSPLSAEVKHV